jgi:Ni/Co efflux regulator RcnB
MKVFDKAVALAVLSSSLTAGVAFAQPGRGPGGPYDNHHYVRHNDWRSGHRMAQNDWRRGQRIDYRSHRLPPPRRGYEWREVDGNYVMAAVATGLIASVIAASAAQ